MAKMSAKGAKILVDNAAGAAQDISADCVSYEIQYAVDPVEITGFGEGSHNFTPGQKVISISLDVLWNTAATTGAMTVLYPIVGSTTSKTVSVQPEGTGMALSGEYMLEGIQPAGKPDGSIGLGTCKFSVMGATAPTWA